ncbi:unnamed protein product [Arabis nemorensis]|uniref:Prolamin-like domain-containing protein n=1 Tax=Arabis nemorensis TaxID=586526 RepID=A0A565CMF9_9BRAS|nr:unnamed protein product [Arabis nemorensis]
MKTVTLVFAIILLSSCVTSQFLEPTDYEDLQWWNSPDMPLSNTKGHHFRPSSELAICFYDHKKVTKCLTQAFKSKPTIGSESCNCCAAIKTLNEDCEKTAFGSFRNPFFNYYVKKHCYTQGGSTPAAPSPA